jgi:hypothetical protein
MKHKIYNKYRRHELDGFSGKEYFASHGKRQHYKKEFVREWTPIKRKQFRAGCKLIDDGARIEVVVGIVKEFRHG